ncbi:MAG: Ltp family lipoprotein [Agathobacter sp.]
MSTDEERNKNQNLEGGNASTNESNEQANWEKSVLCTPSDDRGTEKKKMSKRTLIEIVVGVIALFIIIGSGGGPSQEEYDKLEEKYDNLEAKYEDQAAELEGITGEYSAYKQKMSKFDSLSEEEIDALIDKVDTIIAEKKQKEEEEKKAAEEAAAAEAARQQALNSATIGQKNALSTAKSYLAYSSFSYTGLIDQLEYEGYSTEEATYGADNCGADWNEQAAKTAESYMKYSSFSRQGLIDQLLYEGFTQEQAEYGVASVGY